MSVPSLHRESTDSLIYQHTSLGSLCYIHHLVLCAIILEDTPNLEIGESRVNI